MKPGQKCSNYSMHNAAVPHLIGELIETPADTWDHAQTGCTIQMLALNVWFIQAVETAQSAKMLAVKAQDAESSPEKPHHKARCGVEHF